MSRYSDAPDHVKVLAREAVASDPPLTDAQKAAVRATFADSGLRRATG